MKRLGWTREVHPPWLPEIGAVSSGLPARVVHRKKSGRCFRSRAGFKDYMVKKKHIEPTSSYVGWQEWRKGESSFLWQKPLLLDRGSLFPAGSPRRLKSFQEEKQHLPTHILAGPEFACPEMWHRQAFQHAGVLSTTALRKAYSGEHTTPKSRSIILLKFMGTFKECSTKIIYSWSDWGTSCINEN